MIAVCLKWVDQRPELDATGVVDSEPDARFAGVSVADQAALEWALRCRDRSGDDVTAIVVGPSAAVQVLRDALATGATHAVRVDVPFDAPSHSVAACLAERIADAQLVWCGDASMDRGTGSVPAFLAAALACGQALGLVGVELTDSGIIGTRRLDGGRREVLGIDDRAVLSVEGSTARLRRAPLRALMRSPEITVHAPQTAVWTATVGTSRPYRPRPPAMPSPTGATALDRIKVLTAADSTGAHGETAVLPPAQAADRILLALREWGYIG